MGLHGIQSHSGWFEYSSAKLAEAGFEVYFSDRRGSGLNGFLRGHADHGMRLLNDTRQLIQLVRREHPGVPVTLMGLSWGGKTAAAFAATYPELIDRLALLYPGLEPRLGPTRWQLRRLNLARKHDIRDRSVPVPLSDPALFTGNPAWQRFIANDPLALHFVTSGFLNSGRNLDDIVRKCPERIVHPLLVMLAGEDQIIDNHRTRLRIAEFGTRRLLSILYPDARHTLEFEEDRDVFIADLTNWLRGNS